MDAPSVLRRVGADRRGTGDGIRHHRPQGGGTERERVPGQARTQPQVVTRADDDCGLACKRCEPCIAQHADEAERIGVAPDDATFFEHHCVDSADAGGRFIVFGGESAA